jgi:site-specific recombinase XerD
MKEKRNIHPHNLKVKLLTKELIVDYLNWLEIERKCAISTRNTRLAAIHSFIKFLEFENPVDLFEYQRILSIKAKKSKSPIIPYLSLKEMKSILKQPDQKCSREYRDLVLITCLYDTGARVQELIDLKVDDVRFDSPATIRLTGKGNKVRIVPLMGNTRDLLKKYYEYNSLHQRKHSDHSYLFQNNQKQKLTRAGISYIIKKYVSRASESENEISIKVTPHIFRHSKAVHLLESGIELIQIRDFLGHSSIQTTEIYVKVNSKIKREALETNYQEVTDDISGDWDKDADLIKWLSNLSKH